MKLQNSTRLLISLLLLGWLNIGLAQANPEETRPMGATRLSPAKALSGISLVDQRGGEVSETQLVGRWTLVFFGFSHCPHICPTSLALLKATRPLLPEPVDVLFVSVDPMRDTQERLRDYMENFGEGFTGATAPLAGLLPVLKSFGVSYSYRAGEDGYDVEHSTAVYLVNPQAEMAAVVTSPSSPEELAKFLAGQMKR